MCYPSKLLIVRYAGCLIRVADYVEVHAGYYYNFFLDRGEATALNEGDRWLAWTAYPIIGTGSSHPRGDIL